MLKYIVSLASVLTAVWGQTTGCFTTNCVFKNPYLRFGPGTQSSVNAHGLFIQPFYYSHIASQWYQLTYANYPLDTAIGSGTSGPNWSGATVVDLYSLTPSSAITDYSGFIQTSNDATTTIGHGTIVATRSFILLGQNITFQNTFSLGPNDSFVKIITRVTNNDTSPIQNIRIWVGTRDDYVGTTDVNTKTRGNLDTGSFVAVTMANQSSRAIMITNPTEGILFYSETPDVMTSYNLCCAFANAYNTYPLTLAPFTPSPTDGSYAAVLPIGNLSVGESTAITWYYAAGVISSLSTVAQNVAAAQVADSAPVATATSMVTATSAPSPSAYASVSVSASVSSSASVSVTMTPILTQSAVATYTACPMIVCPPAPQCEVFSVPSIPMKDAVSISGISAFISFVITSVVFYILFFLIILPCYKAREKHPCLYCPKEDTKEKLREHMINCIGHKNEYIRRLDSQSP
jgi:hypothetical protein